MSEKMMPSPEEIVKFEEKRKINDAMLKENGAEENERGTLELTPAQKEVAQYENELQTYGEKFKLRGLEGRTLRGLDPAGMLAAQQTREKIQKIADVFAVSIADVELLTNALHTGAIWDNSKKLAEGSDPAIKTWMILAEATVSEKGTEGDISAEEFLKDLERINVLLDEAVQNPESFQQRAHKNLVNQSKEKFTDEDGVPFSQFDEGFLAMAINGYEGGIVQQGDLMFAGSKKLNFEILKKHGLQAIEKEDRGRMATFYVDADGKDVVKKLYDGFAIILNGDKEIAKLLVPHKKETEYNEEEEVGMMEEGNEY